MMLLMLGILGILMVQSGKLSSYIKENLQVNVFLDDDIPVTDVQAALTRLRNSSYTKSAVFISKEQAAVEFSREIGQDFVSFLGYNPLMPSIQLNLKSGYTSPALLDNIERDLRSLPHVKEIAYPKTIFEDIDRNIRTIGGILVVLALLFVIIAVTLINSTVRLNLYTRRFLIKSMQLVGATRWFIMRPFMTKAMLHGFWGALMAIAILTGILYALPLWIEKINILYDDAAFTVLFVFLLLLGILISMLSSLWSTRHYLKTRIEDLY